MSTARQTILNPNPKPCVRFAKGTCSGEQCLLDHAPELNPQLVIMRDRDYMVPITKYVSCLRCLDKGLKCDKLEHDDGPQDPCSQCRHHLGDNPSKPCKLTDKSLNDVLWHLMVSRAPQLYILPQFKAADHNSKGQMLDVRQDWQGLTAEQTLQSPYLDIPAEVFQHPRACLCPPEDSSTSLDEWHRRVGTERFEHGLHMQSLNKRRRVDEPSRSSVVSPRAPSTSMAPATSTALSTSASPSSHDECSSYRDGWCYIKRPAPHPILGEYKSVTIDFATGTITWDFVTPPPAVASLPPPSTVASHTSRNPFGPHNPYLLPQSYATPRLSRPIAQPRSASRIPSRPSPVTQQTADPTQSARSMYGVENQPLIVEASPVDAPQFTTMENALSVLVLQEPDEMDYDIHYEPDRTGYFPGVLLPPSSFEASSFERLPSSFPA